MKQKLLIFLFSLLAIEYSYAQQYSFSSYYKDGLYKFDDLTKINKDQIFTSYLSNFGFTHNNTMSLLSSGIMDDKGGISDRYTQYCNGYVVEPTMMNVISKYGVVLYVNGFSLPYLNTNVASPISNSAALDSALKYINASKYAWQDSGLEASIKMIIHHLSSDTTQPADTTYDTTRTWYPKGDLVITTPYGDTNIHDTSKYRLCWKYCINALYLDTAAVDTNTVDSVPHYQTISLYRLHNEVIVYVDAHTGQVYRYDPNYNSAWTATVHTYHEGVQNVDIHYNGAGWRGWFGKGNKFDMHDDNRNISVRNFKEDFSIATSNTDNWSNNTLFDAYWQLKTTSDYFRYVHGFYGPSQPPASYKYEQVIVANGFFKLSEAMSGYWAGFSKNNTTQQDNYSFSTDQGYIGVANLDVTAHEYTHAIIQHGPNFDNTGEAAAIMEGLCDYWGTIVGYQQYPSRYTSDWSKGFGWQTYFLARNFGDPTADIPSSSSAAYHDAYWADDKYVQSGVLRHQIALLAWGGTFNGIHVDPVGATENDIFITMNWWLWGSMNYYDLRNQFLGEYEHYYGKCSPKWQSMARSWAAVNVGGIPLCAMHRLDGPRVVTAGQLNTPIARVTVHLNDEGTTPIGHVTWILSGAWNVTYDQDNSGFTLNSTTDYNSKLVTCIVTNIDSTKDTVTTVLHFATGSPKPSFSQSQQDDDVRIFPNPLSKQLNIILPFEPTNGMLATISDIMGKIVLTNRLNTQTNSISLPTLPAGTYIIKIEGEKKEYIKKLTIE